MRSPSYLFLSSGAFSCRSLWRRLLVLAVFSVNFHDHHDVAAANPCDESRCRGERVHPWVDNDTEYTCWVSVDVTDAELADPDKGYCAEGYVGFLVDPNNDYRQVDGETRTWYTCCPADYEGSISRTCSDTACSSPDWTGSGNCWADGFQEPMTCGNKVFRHPRFTGLQSLIYVQYVCCDSPQIDDPLQNELLLARSVWMTLSAITLLACAVFIGGILSSRKARAQGFNLYLVFLAIPDALANITIIVRNALTIPGLPIHPNVFIFVASFEYFYASANMWLNAVIVAFIHRILYKAHRMVRVAPPSVRLVCMQAAVVYFVAAIVFGWAFYLYHEGLNVFSLVTVVNVWISTRAIMVGPPLLYILGVCFDVYHRKLLPLSGRTRVTALYFLRVIIVFMLTWVPYFIIYEIAWNITNSRVMVYFSYYLGSVQGLISVVVAMTKPDVKRAVYRFLFCRLSHEEEEEKRFAETVYRASSAFRGSRSEASSASFMKRLRFSVSKSMVNHSIIRHSENPHSMWEGEDVWASSHNLAASVAEHDATQQEMPSENGAEPSSTTVFTKDVMSGRGTSAVSSALERAAQRVERYEEQKAQEQPDSVSSHRARDTDHADYWSNLTSSNGPSRSVTTERRAPTSFSSCPEPIMEESADEMSEQASQDDIVVQDKLSAIQSEESAQPDKDPSSLHNTNHLSCFDEEETSEVFVEEHIHDPSARSLAYNGGDSILVSSIPDDSQLEMKLSAQGNLLPDLDIETTQTPTNNRMVDGEEINVPLQTHNNGGVPSDP